MPIRINRLDKKQLDEAFYEPEPKSELRRERSFIRRGLPPVIKDNRFIICVDGEGETIDADGTHIYTLLAACDTDGSYFDKIDHQLAPLSTDRCLWFLFDLPQSAIKVSFYFKYDVNMILKDLPVRYLRILHEKKHVWWKGWSLTYIPGKQFTITRKDADGGKQSSTIWDMFGFFQKSFVKTIDEWQVGTPEERALITEMKLKRSTFIKEDPEKIAEYCKLECRLGAETFRKVLDHAKLLHLKLRRYDGAGSVATAMFRKHDVQNYIHQVRNRLPDDVIKCGYHGGRFDFAAFGECGTAIERDINSAYPYQALHLPCLSCGSWEYRSDYDGGSPWAIWDVSWDIDQYALWSPFPYRSNRGQKYLRNGSGWYWANEVREAIALYPSTIQVRGGFVYTTDCIHRPFEFIREYYSARQELVAQGNLAEMIIKLGLNSLYGKLAQSVGRFQKVPKTQCFIWAGMITSGTRGMLLRAIRDAPGEALLLATDAVITRHQSDEDEGLGLGQWKTTDLQNLFIVGNGFYQAETSNPKKPMKERTRGFNPNDIRFTDEATGVVTDHWKQIREQARKCDRFDHGISEEYFVGLGDALNNDAANMASWRHWIKRDHFIKYGNFKDTEKRVEGHMLYPGENKTPELMSLPHKVDLYRIDDEAPMLEVLDDEFIEQII